MQIGNGSVPIVTRRGSDVLRPYTRYGELHDQTDRHAERALPTKRRPSTRRGRQRGALYVGLMVAIAILGVMLMQFGVLWSTLQKRDRESELLARGDEMRRALESYSRRGPVAGTFPKTLEDLVLDKRMPTVVRHLRRVYIDPLTGGAEWGIVTGPGGGIIGLYSLADGVPYKRDGFPERDASFRGKVHYSQWVFMADQK